MMPKSRQAVIKWKLHFGTFTRTNIYINV